MSRGQISINTPSLYKEREKEKEKMITLRFNEEPEKTVENAANGSLRLNHGLHLTGKWYILFCIVRCVSSR